MAEQLDRSQSDLRQPTPCLFSYSAFQELQKDEIKILSSAETE